MHTQGQVLARLLRIVNGQLKKDANYDIALNILTHYSEITSYTINDLADKCFVSTASISRFIRLLGFNSFVDFKVACQNTLKISQTDYSLETSKAQKEDVEPIFANYTKHVTDNIEYVFKNLDYSQLNRICETMKSCDEILFLGLEFSTILGQHFQNRMALMNKYIKLGISYEEQLELAKSMKPNGVVVIATVEGGYFYRNNDIVDELINKNAYIIVLTMNNNMKIMKDVKEIVLCSKGNSDTEGRISLLYCIEIIIMYYFINYSHF